MTRETKKLFKVKRKITPLTVLVPLLLVVLLVCAVIYDNSRIVLDEVTFSMPTLPRDMDGYTILHISDHPGAPLRRGGRGPWTRRWATASTTSWS